MGNIFFTRQALEQLVRKNVLYYDTISFSWAWNLQTDQLQELLSDEEGPWAEWRRGNPITARGIAKLLKPYGISPTKDRNGRFYRVNDFRDAFARYLESPSE